MLVIGVVLFLVGAAVAAFTAGIIRILGVIVAALGVLLILIVVLDSADAETSASQLALLGVLGMASSPEIAGRPRPVLLTFLLAGTPVVAAFALQVLETTDVLDSALWLRTALTGLGAVVGALGTAWSQAQVTPLVDPIDEAHRPLARRVPAEQSAPDYSHGDHV